MKLYPYALFDMDGTMTDSMPYWQNVGADYLKRKGLLPKPGLWETISTKTYADVAALMNRDYGITDDAAAVSAEINQIMEMHYRDDIPLKSGVADYVRFLYDSGVKMGICSATAVHLVKMTLERAGVLKFFSGITSCEEAGGTDKTRPEVFLLALKRLGASPEETVMYEDAPFGIRTAGSIGMHVCRVYDDSYADSFEDAGIPYDSFVSNFSDLTFCPQERK